MSFHIGKLIRKQLDEVGMTKSEFARRIEASPQNIHYILKRKSLDTELLQRISRALNYDFFQHYIGLTPASMSETSLVGDTTSKLRQELDQVREEIATISRHNGYLREIVTLIKPGLAVSPARTGIKTTNKQSIHLTEAKTRKKKIPARKKG